LDSFKIVATLTVLITAAWAILLISAYLIFSVIVPITPPFDSDYALILVYAIGKAVAAVIIAAIWLFSFYLLRDMYARVTGLVQTPSSSSSDQRHAENKGA